MRLFSLGGQDNYAFSPDGQEICYTSNHDKVEATSTNNDLWIVPVNGGAAKNITADNPASDSTPLYSPDGKYIAYRAQQRPGYESDRFRLMLYDREDGREEESDGRILTAGWERLHGIPIRRQSICVRGCGESSSIRPHFPGWLSQFDVPGTFPVITH
jgi:dipeptidyl aminopeptidase/acylaminoacyl peptidase